MDNDDPYWEHCRNNNRKLDRVGFVTSWVVVTKTIILFTILNMLNNDAFGPVSMHCILYSTDGVYEHHLYRTPSDEEYFQDQSLHTTRSNKNWVTSSQSTQEWTDAIQPYFAIWWNNHNEYEIEKNHNNSSGRCKLRVKRWCNNNSNITHIFKHWNEETIPVIEMEYRLTQGR